MQLSKLSTKRLTSSYQILLLYFNRIITIVYTEFQHGTCQKIIGYQCISTHQFPFKWLGGSSAAKKIVSLCIAKGADVLGSAVVDWSPEKKRQSKITAAVSEISGLF